MNAITNFRKRLLENDPDDIVREVLLDDNAKHVQRANINYIEDKIKIRFGINSRDIHIYIVGSAKLGFSITQKVKRGIQI